MKLKQTQFAPKGGWRYEEPSTGQVITAISLPLLIALVKKARRAKGIAEGDVEDDVHTYLCQRIGLRECVQGDPNNMKPNTGITLGGVMSFLDSVRFVIKNGGVVDQATADSRAAVCLSCPMNTNTAGCTPCMGIATKIYQMLGARATQGQDNLKQCGACGCDLKAKVWITKDNLKKIQQVKQADVHYPPHCWVKNE